MIIRFNSEFGEEVTTQEHKKWKDEHEIDLKFAKEKEICPRCGQKLLKDDVLFDHGFKCGLECEYCS